MSDYTGVIIEESLENVSILKKIKIIKTKVEKVTEKHKTPWLKKWTLHTVEIEENKAKKITEEISHSLESKHSWYADCDILLALKDCPDGQLFASQKARRPSIQPKAWCCS
ncbi:MAG: hypothetical protein NTX24_00380 [Candidatus Pacearchaeota archaeon]|nr:hypothetical protein [Candidatus Pacearchaeota archaeon]